MGDAGLFAAIQASGAAWAILVAPWLIVASVITAIIRGLLVPRKSHDEIVNTYKERAAEAVVREQWWRDQAYAENTVAGRSVELAADLATRRSPSRPARDGGQGAANG